MTNKSKNHTSIHLLLENQIIFWDFKIQNSIRITEGLIMEIWIIEGSDNGDSDNRGPTVPIIAIQNYDLPYEWSPLTLLKLYHQ